MPTENENLGRYWKTVDSVTDRYPAQSIIKDYRKLIDCLELKEVKDKVVHDDGKRPFPYIKIEIADDEDGFDVTTKYIVFVDFAILVDYLGDFLFIEDETYKYINKTKCNVCGFDGCYILNQFNKYRDKKIKYHRCCEHPITTSCICSGCKKYFRS
jgi:hypothetical protein